MMIRTVSILLTVALLLAVPALAECPASTVSLEEFQKQSTHLKPDYFQAKPAAFKRVIDYVNHNRAGKGSDLFVADVFMIGRFFDGPMPKVGLAFVSKGCLVQGSIFSLDPALWIQVMISMGVKSDDFEPMIIGEGI